MSRYILTVMVDSEEASGMLKDIDRPQALLEFVASNVDSDGGQLSMTETVETLVRSMCRQINKWEE